MPWLEPRRRPGRTCRPRSSSAPKRRSMPSSATFANNGDNGAPWGAPAVVGFHVPSSTVSGSRAPLPRPSPLRTGRDDCSSSGSSLGRLAPDPRVVPMMTPPVCQPRPAFWRRAPHAVGAGCRPARVLLGHPASREPFCGCGANQELLQVLRLLLVPGRRGTVDPTLQSPHGSFHRSPINVGPRRLLPFAGLFGLHRLTSPAIQALHVFPTVETMAEVCTLSGRVSPRHRGPVRPITGRPSLAPPLL